MQIEVFTDGSATTVDKPGGWAFVLVVNDIKYAECSGYMPNASNNDAEMEAAIQGLAATLKYVITETPDFSTYKESLNLSVTLASDSELILGWASGRYRFKQTGKLEQYNKLISLMKRLHAKTKWVKGHSGHEHNERCDKLANLARLSKNNRKEKADAILAGNTLIGTKKSGTIAIWYKNCLKVIDLETNIIENYDRTIHGPRGGTLEVREEKSR